ncbi:MAG: hypothetical protein GDA36_10965 [Rhodobacteraceae bacterium]|nr:hypothetical protein [Paracoccaceae bacterium]
MAECAPEWPEWSDIDERLIELPRGNRGSAFNQQIIIQQNTAKPELSDQACRPFYWGTGLRGCTYKRVGDINNGGVIDALAQARSALRPPYIAAAANFSNTCTENCAAEKAKAKDQKGSKTC